MTGSNADRYEETIRKHYSLTWIQSAPYVFVMTEVWHCGEIRIAEAPLDEFGRTC